MANNNSKKDKYLAILTYVIPLLFFISAMSETLPFIPSLIIVGSGIFFALANKKNELVKFHGVQSCLFNVVPCVLLFVISKIFIATNYLTHETGFSVYMTIYSTLNLLVFFFPAYGIYSASKLSFGNIPLITNLIKKVASRI